MNLLKKLFGKVTDRELAAQQLAQAKLDLLAAQQSLSYAKALMQHNEDMIRRLERY